MQVNNLISKSSKFIKDIPTKHFALFSALVVIAALLVWFSIYNKHSELIHEKFADIVEGVQKACNGEGTFPEIFKESEVKTTADKCDYCSDAALVMQLQ
jgi:hypothetical protein